MDGQNIFYHYTSINSLYNIIMSRELWLTNLKSSNDKSERYYTVNHMLKDMDEIINNSTDDNFKQYLSLLKKSFETHMPDLKNYLKKSDGYSLSLTDKKIISHIGKDMLLVIVVFVSVSTWINSM